MRNLILVMFMLVMSTAAFAKQNFKYFKLTDNYQQKISEQGLSVKSNGKKELSPLLQKIWDRVKEEALDQVNKLTADIIDYNQDFKLGGINTPGIDWESQSKGEFELVIGRRVDPTLESDNWQVKDVLGVTIKASTYLKLMRDGGIIDISDEKLKLFADISFSRSYTYHHFATSYKNGLTKNFNKLFLGFNYFRGINFLDISEGEVITKDDYLGANLKLSVSTPSMYFMSGQGKGSVYHSKLSSLSYHKPFNRNTYNEFDVLRASKRTTKITGANLQLNLQADFYSLLTITILGAEYQTDMTKTTSTNITFTADEASLITKDSDLAKAFSELNKGKKPRQLVALRKYITSTEVGNRVSEELNLYALIWGKHMGTATEEFVFNSAHGTRYLYRHNEENTSLIKSWWDGIFRVDNVGKFDRRSIENMSFEYEGDKGERDFKEINLELPANISFRISKQFKTKKNKKSYNEKAIDLIKSFENIDGQVIQGISDGTLKGPFTLDLHAQVSSDGISALLFRDQEELFGIFQDLCQTQNISSDVEVSAKGSKCLKRLSNTYQVVVNDFFTSKTVNLYNLKRFLQSVTKYAKNFQSVKRIFGEEYVQLYGHLQSKTKDSKIFKTFFKEGESQGYGVIKDFVKSIE